MISVIGSTIRQSFVVAGKEFRELRRQPGVLLLVVLGPFLVLAAFGLGYRNEELALRTIFVGPERGPFEEAIDRYAGSIDDYVVPLAFTSDLFAATRDLKAGRADIVIVLPPSPIEAAANGDQSEIAVLHNSIDPIEQIGIQFATEVAVRELNATVVTASVDALLSAGRRLDTEGSSLVGQLDEFEAAAANRDDAEIERLASEIQDQLQSVEPILELSSLSAETTSDGADDDDELVANSTSISAIAEYLEAAVANPAGVDPDNIEVFRRDFDRIDAEFASVLASDPIALSRPFFGDAESLVRERVAAEDHVAPGATALLLQHLGVSLAALSLVRDDRRGLLTDYRVGPVSIVGVLVGKLGSLSVVAFGAGAVIIAGQTTLLGVPQRGSQLLLAATLALLAVASVSLGLVLASLGRSELSASQTAMIALLSALFFSGFILDLDLIREPFRSIGLFVPARPAVSALRAIQLRGETPILADFAVLITQAVAGVALASTLISRRWRKQS